LHDDKRVRVRFAPSPTGYLHIGGARTALFNWLFARANGGTFILRIEDTDRSRYVEDSLYDIMESLKWLGMDWDEGPQVGGEYGPYMQSERLHIYQEYIKILLDSGHAYYCYCSSERLEALRAEQAAKSMPPGYDRHCRDLSSKERQELEAQGIKPVIRFKVPLEGTTKFNDLLRGEISFENNTLDDLVLIKSDGYPTYHFANIVDDHLMGITHVMRGEEWIPSTPKHLLLYQAMGWEAPQMAHMPVILSQEGGKLSKRHGATTVKEFREKGYLPEAMVNFLALLGWTLDGERELFSLQELQKVFSLDRVSKSSAVFSYDKLDWLNGLYIRELSVEDLTRRVLPYLEKAGIVSNPITPEEHGYLLKIIPLVQERIKFLSETPELVDFFFQDEVTYTDPSLLIPKKLDSQETLKILRCAHTTLSGTEDYSEANLETLLRGLSTELGMKAGQVFMPVRVAITGRTAAPGLFETISVLGKERTVKRLLGAISALEDAEI
jgi:glutamyl-tRNA synthetase